MKKLSLFVFLLFLSIGLFGCQQSGEGEELKNEIIENTNGSTAQNLPKLMPGDFDFSIQFDVQKKNEMNTFVGMVTKDLIADGIASSDLILTEEEMEDIYRKMVEIKITEPKEFTPEPINGEVCTQEPYEEDEWNIVINGETLTHLISGSFCEPTDDAKQLIELRNYVFNIVKSKDEYNSLPESHGGYE
ncbi:MAG TPA: hypothetical protein VLQ20_13620 [Planococcus sp. (in: firmicutes)]|nr:hypothetical protein [Planococcus sp. (in: firmicutes)]